MVVGPAIPADLPGDTNRAEPVIVIQSADRDAEPPAAAPAVDEANLAPMLRHYTQLKQRYPEHLLLFQVGDFYEVFFDDARTVSEALQIRLTSRNKDEPRPIPMCGVPIHAIDNYLPRLLRAGFSCVLVSQTEDARGKKGMVQRDVTRIVTPGVRYEGDGLDEKSFNYLASLCPSGAGAALTFVDVSTGRMKIASAELEEDVCDLLRRYVPAELILPSTVDGRAVDRGHPLLRAARAYAGEWGCKVLYRPMRQVLRETAGERLGSMLTPLPGSEARGRAAAITELLSREGTASLLATLDYVDEISFGTLPKLSDVVVEDQAKAVFMDAATRRNLEITEARIDGNRRHSLLHQIDCAKTAMGSRLLSEWVLGPSVDPAEITARHDAVEELCGAFDVLRGVREIFASVRDIDRLLSRVTSLRATPRDLGALRDSIGRFADVHELISQCTSPLISALRDGFDSLSDLAGRLAAALVPDPPMRVSEGGIIKEGYHPEVDRLRTLADDAEGALLRLEQSERERTGLPVKVKYNNVFGYFIELSKAHAGKAPAHYERRQTLVNAERYVTAELKEFEHQVLSAKARQQELERELFAELRTAIAADAGRIQRAARVLAELDVLGAFAHRATEGRYVRPVLRDGARTVIRGGRHAVVEQIIGSHNFIPNDTELDTEGRRFALLTGPNMGGKSTYLRQVGLIQLLAQAGSFVPAAYAELSIVDRIFTRIGAADDLARGDSTFMVEMREAASIVRRATRSSLVLIDEIGRGTATNDGLSIATAIAEWLHDVVRCKTIFATHFHELTQIVGSREGVFPLSVGIIEDGRDIVFSHRIEERAAERSFGVEVARLAGLPESIVARARALMAALEEEGDRLIPLVAPTAAHEPAARLPEGPAVRDRLRERLQAINPDALTPLQALVELAELKMLVDAE